MLPKSHRLTRKKDFDAVFSKGSFVKSRSFTIVSAKNGLAVSRFGFVVSKKISSKATVRNKVKRVMRQAVSEKLSAKGICKDVVLVALPGIEKKEFGEIQKEINKIL